MKEGLSSPSVITIECCGVLVGSSSEEIAEHICLSWQAGQECVELLREALGPELADMYVPLTNGGVYCTNYKESCMILVILQTKLLV